MTGKVSNKMERAMMMIAAGYDVAYSAYKSGVTARGLRYALNRKKEKKTIDKRKR